MKSISRWLALGAVLALMAAACDVPDPQVVDLVRLDWGDSVRPNHRDVAYGPERGCASGSDEPCGGSQELDIYRVRAGGNRGTLVYIHGGGFAAGDKYPLTNLGNLKRQLHRGYSIVSINHRLANALFDADGEFVVEWKGPLPWPFVQTDGSNNFPDAMTDVASALEWVRREGPRYGLSTNRIVVAGFSNAGAMAALAGTGANSTDPVLSTMPPVNGWVSIAGPLDWDVFPDGNHWGEVWMGDDWPAQKERSNPINYYDEADPPGYLLYGSRDVLVPVANAEAYRRRAKQLGDLAEAKVAVDIVDRLADGRPMTATNTGHLDPRFHVPTGGMNATFFDLWLDDR